MVTLDPIATSKLGSAPFHVKTFTIQTKWSSGEIVADQIGLEERAHLCVARARVIEDEEMDLEGRHVNQDGQYNETGDACTPVSCLIALYSY
jgi:hypothetical protein